MNTHSSSPPPGRTTYSDPTVRKRAASSSPIDYSKRPSKLPSQTRGSVQDIVHNDSGNDLSPIAEIEQHLN